MKHSEALKFKNKLGDYITENDLIMKIVVTPQNDKDLSKFVDDYRVFNFNDNSSKQYSKDSRFEVYALWTDGANIIQKKMS